ncbi:EF-hand calcium-binding domain-containing protein 12 [Pogoniulus pusillus]|uniref:EF-hand calcium-binding domain-containing protein 12 n=1 Tax=Pogoniulus pusillus TaxID=488313 RepID=UPI0030B9AC26
MARPGNVSVHEHCLPSTVPAGLGGLVDQYRRKAARSYLRSSELCRERSVCITNPALQRGLLHPGDRIRKEGAELRIRQPGGYYSTGRGYALALGSSSRSSSASGSQHKKGGKRSLQWDKMSNDNRFWPGHLLDKLCLYFPEQPHDRAHALFSLVLPTKHIYPGR